MLWKGAMDHYKDTLKTDCEEILGRFQATASVRFEEFSAIWRETKFSCVFNDITVSIEARAFTRLALSTAYPYFFPPYSFQIRVGGLYLLYGLYNTQLIKPKEKIWLALKDWDELMRFEQDSASAQHYDVVYILKQLQCDKAFTFTAMPKTLFFKVKKRLVERRPQPNLAFVDRPSRPQELVNTDMLEELDNVHEHYESLKNAVLGESGQSELSLVRQNLMPRLRSAVLTFYDWQRNQTGDEDAGEGTSSQNESSSRALRLAEIKSRSYGQAIEASKSRRHRQIQLTSAAVDSDATQKVSSNKKLLSLKERTELCLMSQGKLNEEILGATQLWKIARAEDKQSKKKRIRRFNWKESCSEKE